MGKVLVACEESQAVCNAFRALGHEAYSCDIQPCSGGEGGNMKLGSLFDGSGGFPLAATMCGIIPVWASKVSDPKTRPFKFSNEMEDWEYHG